MSEASHDDTALDCQPREDSIDGKSGVLLRTSSFNRYFVMNDGMRRFLYCTIIDQPLDRPISPETLKISMARVQLSSGPQVPVVLCRSRKTME